MNNFEITHISDDICSNDYHFWANYVRAFDKSYYHVLQQLASMTYVSPLKIFYMCEICDVNTHNNMYTYFIHHLCCEEYTYLDNYNYELHAYAYKNNRYDLENECYGHYRDMFNNIGIIAMRANAIQSNIHGVSIYTSDTYYTKLSIKDRSDKYLSVILEY